MNPGTTGEGWRTPFVILFAGTLIVLLSLGVRMTYALWLEPATNDLWPGQYSILSLSIALQSLFWGVATPVAGAIADRYGTGRVLACAGLLYTAGLLLMSVSTTPLMAHFSIGVMTGFAMSGAMFPIVLSAISRVVAPEKRDIYLGIASAGGSSGQVVLVPVGQYFVDTEGWVVTLYVMAFFTFLIVPLAFAMVRKNSPAIAESVRPSALSMLRLASQNRSYLLLMGGYFVCGLQTMFLGTHFPTMLVGTGIDAATAAYSLSVIGIFNIAGTFLWGAAGGRFRPKYLLCWLYSGRSLVMIVFILLPITPVSVMVFSGLIGLLWLGTVPLTGSIVARMFGLQNMGMLFGLAFVAHQLGSFIGIYAAGYLFERFGSYDIVWWAAVVMGLVASLMNYPINDRPVERPAAAQPA